MGNNIVCNCGNEIPDEDIEKSNGSNEEGEEYGEVRALCSRCGTYWETSQWGEWDSMDEAKEVLQEYIKVYAA
jgi:hypothetical protein